MSCGLSAFSKETSSSGTDVRCFNLSLFAEQNEHAKLHVDVGFNISCIMSIDRFYYYRLLHHLDCIYFGIIKINVPFVATSLQSFISIQSTNFIALSNLDLSMPSIAVEQPSKKQENIAKTRYLINIVPFTNTSQTSSRHSQVNVFDAYIHLVLCTHSI